MLPNKILEQTGISCMYTGQQVRRAEGWLTTVLKLLYHSGIPVGSWRDICEKHSVTLNTDMILTVANNETEMKADSWG